MVQPDGEHTHERDPQGPHRHVLLEAAIVGLGNAVRELAMNLPTTEAPVPMSSGQADRVLRMVDVALEELEPRPRHLGG